MRSKNGKLCSTLPLKFSTCMRKYLFEVVSIISIISPQLIDCLFKLNQNCLAENTTSSNTTQQNTCVFSIYLHIFKIFAATTCTTALNTLRSTQYGFTVQAPKDKNFDTIAVVITGWITNHRHDQIYSTENIFYSLVNTKISCPLGFFKICIENWNTYHQKDQ